MNDNIVKEIMRRWEILISNAKPRQMDSGMSGSMVLFRTALALIGYPFEKSLKWMDDDYRKPIMTREEFDSNVYDELLDALYELAYDKVNLVNQKTQAEFDAIRNNPVEYTANREANKSLEEIEYNCQFDEWMKDFQIEPKRTRDDLEENEQRMLGELMTELREGNWAIIDAEIKYGKAWFARAEAFEYEETV